MRLHLLLLVFALSPALALAQAPGEAAGAAVPDAGPTATAEATTSEAPMPAPPAPPPPEAPFPKFGLALAAGVPQAATFDLLYRPIPWLRVGAGPTWDYAGWGMHGGLVLSPIRWAVSPTLGVEVGQLSHMDLNRFVDVDAGLQPLLQKVGVRYLTTTIGLEFGSQRGFAFTLRAGLAWIEATTHGTGTLTSGGGVSGQNDAVITVSSPVIRASVPTVQLAFQYFI